MCGIDVGYSSTKCFIDDIRACVPSFARPVPGEHFIGKADENDILYLDENGLWNVGSGALRSTNVRDTNDSETTLYSRYRYDSDMFRILCRVDMAMCLKNEAFINRGGIRPIHAQTGLPSAYMKSDKRDLVSVFAGKQEFDIKFGNHDWKHFSFEIQPHRVDVISQPLEALYSAVINNECRQISDTEEYFNSSILVADPGFGTFDSYLIRNREVVGAESFDNLGMKAVYKLLSDQIYYTYGEVIPVHTVPKILSDGCVEVFNKACVQTESHPIAELLEQCSREICLNAIRKVQATYDNLREVRHLLLARGTGEAWAEAFKEYYSRMKNLKILMGNQNDPELPLAFSIVRGYYMCRTGVFREKQVRSDAG